MDQQDNHQQEILSYYDDTGLDYGEWSREFQHAFRVLPLSDEPFQT